MPADQDRPADRLRRRPHRHRDLAHHRADPRVRRQRVSRHRHRDPLRQRPRRQMREIARAEAQPVAAVDEHHQPLRLALRQEQIEPVPLALAIGQPQPRPRAQPLAECRRLCRPARRILRPARNDNPRSCRPRRSASRPLRWTLTPPAWHSLTRIPREGPMLNSVTHLATLLKDPTLLVTKAYVAGEWIDADDGTTFPVTNPARGDVICTLPESRPGRDRPRHRRRRQGPPRMGRPHRQGTRRDPAQMGRPDGRQCR